MKPTALPLPGTATREAAQWHALHREHALSAEEHARFLDWLTASPEHLREYLAIGRVASELGGALQAMDIDVDALLAADAAAAQGSNVVALPLPPRPLAASGKARPLRMAAMAASLAIVASTATWLCWPRSYAYSTAHAQQRSITLPDHSTLHLNAESEVQARYSLLRREVTLLRGQATFQVGHDRRPFEVLAAGLRVRDIGTTFDVSLQRQQTRISVSEGRVVVSTAASNAGGTPRALADLAAGQSARIDHHGRQVSVRQENIAAMTAWWQRRVVFRDDRLGDVADQFNRLNRVRLVVEDPQAAAMRLTGNLHGDDIDALRIFLDQQPGLQTRQDNEVIRVRSRLR